jgi:hypothetical protein
MNKEDYLLKLAESDHCRYMEHHSWRREDGKTQDKRNHDEYYDF